jgi:predicted DNA-binding transcriptional regulator AlpA
MSSDEHQPGLWDEPGPTEPKSGTVRRRRARTSAPGGRPPGPPAASPVPDRLWTVHDVSVFLGVPRKTIYAWRTTGKGPKGFRVGKHLRWHPRTVFEWSLRLEDEQ